LDDDEELEIALLDEEKTINAKKEKDKGAKGTPKHLQMK